MSCFFGCNCQEIFHETKTIDLKRTDTNTNQIYHLGRQIVFGQIAKCLNCGQEYAWLTYCGEKHERLPEHVRNLFKNNDDFNTQEKLDRALKILAKLDKEQELFEEFLNQTDNEEGSSESSEDEK